MRNDRSIWVVDTETTGIHPELGHVLYDVAILRHDSGIKFHWFLELTSKELAFADPEAMAVGDYYGRAPKVGKIQPSGRVTVAESIAELLKGCIICGMNPHFDNMFLRAFLDTYGIKPTWDYHLLDLWSMSFGVIGPNKGTGDILKALGIDRVQKHTALDDVIDEDEILRRMEKIAESRRTIHRTATSRIEFPM